MQNKYSKKLSIIIVSYNTEKILQDCLVSLIKAVDQKQTEIIIVDNNSEDGSVDMVKRMTKKLPLILIENKKNLGFGMANNVGMKRSKGEYILLLNSDTVVNRKAIAESVKFMDQNKDVGVLGCKLKSKDRSIQSNGGYFPNLWNVFLWMTFLDDIKLIQKFIRPYHINSKSIKKAKDLDWITGAYFLFRSEIKDSVGVFDDDYFMYVEEVDYCYRIKLHEWRVVYNPELEILHLGGASGNSENSIIKEFEGLKIFYEKHNKERLKYLVFLLKLGSMIRRIAFFLLGDRERSTIYAKAYYSI